MRIADYIMQRLHEEGIGHLFMVTGRGMLYLSDAAAKHEGIETVSVHHEQAAGYAAMAYAQKNEKLGACLVSTGCASTNTITPVLCAWQDDVPMVVISGQNSLNETVRHSGIAVRTFGQQEADIIGLVSPITKYAVMIENPARIAYEMDKALFLAQFGRKGPVWIDVPLDVQNMRVEPETLERFYPETRSLSASDTDVDYVVKELRTAQRPVILIGSGVRSAGAGDLLKNLLKKHPFPVVYANSAVDILDSRDSMAIGAVGTMAANRAGNFALQNADLILVLGCRMSSMITGADKDKFARAAKIIMVDIDKNEAEKNTCKIERNITADLKVFLTALSDKTLPSAPDVWLDKCRRWKEMFPRCEDRYRQPGATDLYQLADSLSEVLSDDAVVVTDAGLEELITPTTIRFKAAQRCLHPVSQGAMGYALPAAAGAFYAGGKQVVAVVGDGSVMMNIQELQTISYKQLPLKIIIVNNNCYAVIRKRQKDLFRTRTVGTDCSDGVSCPDFAKVAECFNLKYRKIVNNKNLTAELRAMLAESGAVICEIMSPEDQNYIHSSYARTKEGRFVQRPLEDQSPFLDRELFLSEMIVEPIDQ